MIQAYNKAVDNTVKIDRILGKIEGTQKGPTIVFFGGIHGNETSGIFALKDVLSRTNPDKIKGTVYGVSGNLKAIKQHQRYLDSDLNRLWTKQNIYSIKKKSDLNAEELELLEILDLLSHILETQQPPFYFVDLHTTSSKTLPFITINDALINRKFSEQFPVPVVLGIEEYLTGPLLSYINQLGYVSLGFESGQHDAFSAITNHISFIYLTLVNSGTILSEDVEHYSKYCRTLEQEAQRKHGVFEIKYLYRIKKNEQFKMLEGFKSFEKIEKGTAIASSNTTKIKAPYSGNIFMPLYQEKGAEGFFIIRPIKPIALKLSSLLRKLKTDWILSLLPGISWLNKSEGVLQVNLEVARFFAKDFFHLLGYRNLEITDKHVRLNNRERLAKSAMYKNEYWF